MQLKAEDGSVVELGGLTQDRVGATFFSPIAKPQPRDPNTLNLDQALDLSRQYSQFGSVNPDDEARDREATKLLDLPEWVTLSSDENRQAALEIAKLKKNSPDDWPEFVKQHPATAAYLEQNMALSHDDIPNLAKTESLLKSFERGIQLGQLQKEQGLIWNKLMMRGPNAMAEKIDITNELARDSEIEQRMKSLSAEAIGQADGWSINSFAQQAGQFLPSMMYSAHKGYLRGLQYAATYAAGAAVLGQLGPQALVPEEIVTVPAAALLGFGHGMIAGGFEGAMEIESSTYKDLLEIEDANGKKLDPQTAWALASLAAATKGGLEMVGLSQMLKVIPGGGVILKSIEAKGGQAILDQIKANATNKAVVKTIIKDLAVGVMAETGTEVAQTVTDIAAKNAGIAMSPVDKSLMTPLGGPDDLWSAFVRGQDPNDKNPSAMTQIGETARATIQGTLALGVPGAGVKTYSGVRNVSQFKQQVERDQEFYAKLEETFREVKTATRSPEAAAEFVGHVTDGSAISEVHVDAAAMITLFQDKAPQIAKELGLDPDQLNEAAILGGKISIPTKVFVPQIVQSGMFGALSKDITFDREGKTFNEMQKESKTMEAELVRETEKAQQQADEVIKERSELKTAFDTVLKAEKERFVEAGHTEKEAVANATQVAKSVVVETSRRGGDWKSHWDTLSYDIQLHEKDADGNWTPTKRLVSPARASITTPTEQNAGLPANSGEKVSEPSNGAGLPQSSPYKLMQLQKVENLVTVRDNAPQQLRVYEVSTYPEEMAKVFGEDAPAEIEFKSLEEARAINSNPERVADWQQIYAKAEKLTDFASMRKVNKDGKLETVPVIALTKGCQRAQVSVERVNNGILPNETRVEACYGGTCWVNRQFNSMFGSFENMEVRDLAMTSPDVISKVLGKKGVQQFLSEGPFIREGQMGCSSHAFPILEQFGVSLAEAWLQGVKDAGIKNKTVFITAAYAPVTKESYERLAQFKDLMEIHVSVSGWFHKNELMIRLAEFQAIRDAGLPVALRLVTNKDNVAGLDMVNHEWLMEKMKEMNVQQHEVLETPYHDDAIKKKNQQKRSNPTGEFKYICCETGKCLSCPAKCMTTGKDGSVATSFVVKDIPAKSAVGKKIVPVELAEKDKTAGDDPAVAPAPVQSAGEESSHNPVPGLPIDDPQINDTTSVRKVKGVNVTLNQAANVYNNDGAGAAGVVEFNQEIRSQLKENHAVYQSDEEALRYATEALNQTARVEDSADVRSQQGALDRGQQQDDSRDQEREVSTKRRVASTVGYGITPKLISKGTISLLGKTIRSSRELAVKAQALRHPGYETLHIVYTRQGQVVHHEALSCRLPGQVKFDYNDGQHPVLHMDDILTSLGADGWYFLHNHPSGRPVPSPEDVHITKHYGDMKTSSGSTNNPVNRRFKGHVVINSTQFAVIDRAGNVTMEDLPTKLLAKPDYFTPSKPHPALKTLINDPGVVAGMAKALQLDPDVSVVFVTDAQLVTRAVVEVQNSLFNKDSKTVERYLRLLTRVHNGASLLLSTNNSDLYDSLSGYVEKGFFVDVVHTESENGLRGAGVNPGTYAKDHWMGLPAGQSADVARVLEGNSLYQFAGQNAATANLKQLSFAKDMVASGENPEEVRKITGWFQGSDNLWRFEIDDSKAEILKASDFSNKTVLGDLLSHPDLYLAYPDLKNTRVVVEDKAYGDQGSFSPSKNEITLSRSLFTPFPSPKTIQGLLDNMVKRYAENPQGNKFNPPAFVEQKIQNYKDVLEELKTKGRWQQAALKTILHEVQHYIQEKENFARGGSPEGVSTLVQAEISKYRTLWDKLNAEWQDLGIAAMKAKGKKKTELKRLEKQKAEEMFAVKPPLALEAAHRELKAKLGENPDPQKAFEAYRRLAGEVEARDVSDRMDMTEQDRIDTAPARPGDAIVVWGDSTTIYRSVESEKADPRAAVNLQQRVISYFNLDQSSFSHEFAHIRLNELISEAMRPDGSDAVKADVALIKGWFKQNTETVRDLMRDDIKFLEAKKDRTESQNRRLDMLKVALTDDAAAQTMIDRMTPTDAIEQEYYTQFHELWARGWESYLMEGRAPDPGLRQVFRSFVKWLTKLYKTAVNLNAPISDDVRGVMDRLIATEDEIRQAQANVELAGSMIEELDLPPGTLQDILDLQAKATARAEDILRRSKMKEINAAQKQAEKEERERILPEVRKEVAERPIFDIVDNIKKAFRGRLQSVAEDYLAGKLGETQAMVWDQIADAYEYSSGDELAKEIISAPSFDQAVETEVKARLASFRAALPKVDPMEAIHNENSLELIALQKEILTDMIDTKVMERIQNSMGEDQNVIAQQNNEEQKRQDDEYWKNAIAEAKKGSTRIKAEMDVIRREAAKRAAISVQTLRLQASMVIMPRPVSKIDPFTYFRQERDAAKAAERAMLAKDYQAAVDAKNKQLLNHALAVEAVRAKKRADKLERSMGWFKRRKRDKYKNSENFVQIGHLLERYGFGRNDYNPADRQQSLAEWVATQASMGEVADIAPWLMAEPEGKPFKTLTLPEMENLVNALRNISQIANRVDRTLRAMEGIEIETIAQQLEAARDANYKGRVDKEMSMRRTRWQKIRADAVKYKLDIIDMETLLRELDGFKNFGPWWKTFYQMFDQAASEELRLTKEYFGKIQTILDRYTPAELEMMRTKQRMIGELGQSLTQYDLLALALNWGNKGNRQRLIAGFQRTWGVSLSEEHFLRVLNRELTERDWRTVQGIWDVLNELKPFLYERHKEIVGFEPKSVESDPVETPWGTLPGGYFPLKKDSRYDAAGRRQEEEADPLYKQNSPSSAMTQMGYTKERSSAAVYPVSPDFTVVIRHLQETIHDATHRAAVIDAHKMLRNDHIAAIIQETLGMDGFRLFEKWVNSIAGEKDKEAASTVQGFARAVRSRVSGSVMMLNIPILTQNFSNFMSAYHAADGFDMYNVARSIANFMTGSLRKGKQDEDGNWISGREFVYSKSAFMASRSATVDRDAADLARRLMEGGSRLNQMAATGFVISDLMTSIPVWTEAYRVGMKKYDANEEQAIQYADMVVRRSHGSGLMKDMAQIQKSSEVGRLFTMFGSFALKQVALGYEEFSRVNGLGDMPRFIGFVMSRWILMAVLGELMAFRGAPDDKDDEDWWLWWIRKVGYYPISMLPYIRDFVPAIEVAMGGDSKGNPRFTPVSSIYEDAGRTGKVIRAWWDDKADNDKLLESLSSTASYAVPYPKQFNSWIWNGYDILNDNMEFELVDLLRRRPKKERN